MTYQDQSHQERSREGVFQDWSNSVETRGRWHDKSVVMGRVVTEAIVRAARVGPGMHVLDLASGTGDPTLTLSALVGPNGGVTATDLVPEMLEVAQAQAAKQGLTNITFQQADAESLSFSDQSFDAVTCRLGVMLFANVPQALSEIRRVLNPGGHAAFVAQGPPDQNPWQECILRVFGNYLEMPVPEPDSPHPHKFARPGTLSKALEDAVFDLVEEDSPAVP